MKHLGRLLAGLSVVALMTAAPTLLAQQEEPDAAQIAGQASPSEQPAVAQPDAGQASAMTSAASDLQLLKGSEATGKKIVDQQGKNIGKIEDILLESQEGRVVLFGVSLSEGGEGEIRAVPYEMLTAVSEMPKPTAQGSGASETAEPAATAGEETHESTAKKEESTAKKDESTAKKDETSSTASKTEQGVPAAFVLSTDVQKVESAPFFKKTEWPQRFESDWIRQVYSHYGTTPDLAMTSAAAQDMPPSGAQAGTTEGGTLPVPSVLEPQGGAETAQAGSETETAQAGTETETETAQAGTETETETAQAGTETETAQAGTETETETAQAGTETAQAGAMQNERKLLRLSKLVGQSIQNPKGDKLGKVEEIVLDPQSQRVAYAALSFTGAEGGESKLFAVPWQGIQTQASEEDAKTVQLVVDVDKERLKTMPGFDKKDWPQMLGGQVTDIDAIVAAYESWGVAPYWQASTMTGQQQPGQQPLPGAMTSTGEQAQGQPPSAPLSGSQPATTMTSPSGTGQGMVAERGSELPPILRASKVIGMSVQNEQGEDIGTIEDVALDPAAGGIAYAVLSHGGWLGMGDKLVAVPWSSLRFDTKKRALILPATEQELEQARAIEGEPWPTTATFQPDTGAGAPGATGEVPSGVQPPGVTDPVAPGEDTSQVQPEE